MEQNEEALTIKRLQELDQSLDLSPSRRLSKETLKNLILYTDGTLRNKNGGDKIYLEIARALNFELVLRHNSSETALPPAINGNQQQKDAFLLKPVETSAVVIRIRREGVFDNDIKDKLNQFESQVCSMYS